jgi:hypothetical protein
MALTDEILDVGGATEAAITAYLGGTNFVNSTPVHDATRDMDADNANKWVKLLAELHKRLRPGNLVRYSFDLGTTPVGATTYLPIAGGVTTFYLPFKDASLVGVTAHFATALTAGSATVEACVGTTPCSLTVGLTTAQFYEIARQLPADATSADVWDASAYDNIKARVTTPGGTTWAGSSRLYVDLILSVGEEEDI